LSVACLCCCLCPALLALLRRTAPSLYRRFRLPLLLSRWAAPPHSTVAGSGCRRLSLPVVFGNICRWSCRLSCPASSGRYLLGDRCSSSLFPFLGPTAPLLSEVLPSSRCILFFSSNLRLLFLCFPFIWLSGYWILKFAHTPQPSSSLIHPSPATIHNHNEQLKITDKSTLLWDPRARDL
jgi:hypothetical protein